MESVQWDCFRCDSHNVSSFTFNMYNISTANSFSVLSSITDDSDVLFDRSTVSESSPGMPKRQSSPRAQQFVYASKACRDFELIS